MKKSIRVFFAVLLIASCAGLYAQTHPRGAILDDALYNSLPRKAAQLTRSFEALPSSASLKQFAPAPGDQGAYATCTAWAASYAARTIAESVALNRRDRTLSTSNVFSPVFVYKNISNDPACEAGTAISWALDLMKNPGTPRRSNAEKTSDFRLVPLSSYQTSQKFPIADYVILYNSRRGETSADYSRIQAVKKSLSENKPVIIGMNTPASFDRAKSPWQPAAVPSLNYGGHAMCVIGYDDAQYGGAFEIMNSWSEAWGDGGFIWIRYADFLQFVNQAYEMIENLDTYKDAALFSAAINIEVEGTGKGMPVRFDSNGYYKTQDSYPSGTQFRFIMANNSPAYIYAFSADSATTKTNLIFPIAALNESPVLDYSQTMVAWPAEDDWMQLDKVSGTDYFVILFSKHELDINAIRTRFAASSGSFPARVAAAVGSDFVSPSNVKYDAARINFSGALLNKSSVMGLLLAIDHK